MSRLVNINLHNVDDMDQTTLSKMGRFSLCLFHKTCQVSLAIRGGYIPEKFGSENTKTAVLGLNL